MKKEKNKLLKQLFFIVGSILISLGLCIICFKIYQEYSIEKIENTSIQNFFDIEESDFSNMNNTIDKSQGSSNTVKNSYNYIALLEIPRINLKHGLFSIEDQNNNINKNITILKGSNMPNVENSLLILASHSGNSYISYFRHLDKLEISDKIYIYYQNIKYAYEVINIDRQDKTGNISISKKENETNLVLTTCDPINENKQVIITTKLIDKMPY